ncbi:nitrogen regulation protein NR(I) [Pseudoalteromonas tunicata]|uniref:DNA-binding transcriptional regulator NtrC n=1 Tax=Pseudoalteromonas tunicata D2 TaxID=87626 RepID=A4C7T5_9GAMM|nr:nitrogen regulation protein NR(I) [Pseudoalteromonas tunicata]ATC93155.1 two-component system, NtrC family, nitrogen regulation response regulator GlnG [Pseudoalteromonas tunicata]AXT32226.1 nitrogen regulation protein NR(I) [Pseudoalteromonas tunicata]EAR28650.1 response regulator in two-component regulatory system with GlnL, nitrogen regulation (EBP family) protein [Pseudoalteromonas tunicata D2]MDP4983410.1 nitrogen regulation protein NR(I) [Pseudoalteromonas tunicata]MDP5212709.1 nitrog
MKTVWLVDDDASIRFVLEKALSRAGFQTESFASAESVLSALEYNQPMVLISDVRMPGMDGMTLLEGICKEHPELPVIIMTAHSDLDSAVQAFQKGAFEYLAKPFDLNEAVNLVESACRANAKTKTKPAQAEQKAQDIIGEAPAMQEVFRAIGKLSASSMSVLINGESGTGKELVAGALHNHSPRKEKEFIALNMAAIPKELVESELFGHEKGAFTGADSVRKGRFEQANGGTLFLDEIGDMPLDVQTRLLRVLADGEFYRVGGHQSIKVDVRIIAATHQNLEELVSAGKFRDDLFHRLNVVRLKLPALRERTEDIEKLANYFLTKSAKELKVESKILAPDATKKLKAFHWPGNVRQLENTCRWITVMAPGQIVTEADLPSEVFVSAVKTTQSTDWLEQFQVWFDNELKQGRENIWPDIQAEIEVRLINTALNHCHGHKQDAAVKIGWGRNTLTRKLKERNLN